MRLDALLIYVVSFFVFVPATMASQDASDYIAEGNRLAREKNYSAAIEQFEEAAQQKPDNERINLLLALLYARTGDLDQSLRYAARAAKNDSYLPLFNLGLIYSAREEDEKALESFDKALEANPTSFKAHFQRGLTLSRLKNYEAAGEAFEAALEINPYLQEARIALFGAYLDTGNRASAAEQIAKFREMNNPMIAEALTERMERKT